MKRSTIFLIAAAVFAAAPGAARASDWIESGNRKSDIDHMHRDFKRFKSDRESAEWGAKKARRSATHYDYDTHHYDGDTNLAESFVGNSETKKVHRRECEWAEKIAGGNRDYFETYREAVQNGYTACKVCTPDSEAPERAAPAAGRTMAPKADAESPFIGNMLTRKVHRRACEGTGKISEENRAGFATWKEAKDAGYVACRKCKPEIESLSGPVGAEETPAAREAGAPENAPAATPGGAFIGHSVSKKAHRADCTWAQKISEKDRACFTAWGDAAAAGFTPCKACRPDERSPAPPVPSAGSAPLPPPPSAGADRPANPNKPAAGEFCASSAGKTFHTPNCEWAGKISGKNRVIFKTRDEAVAAGKVPCKACTP